jgi:hypothetical protein
MPFVRRKRWVRTSLLPSYSPYSPLCCGAGITLVVGTEISCEWTFAYPETHGKSVSKVHSSFFLFSCMVCSLIISHRYKQAHLLGYYVAEPSALASTSAAEANGRFASGRERLQRALAGVRLKREQRNTIILQYALFTPSHPPPSFPPFDSSPSLMLPSPTHSLLPPQNAAIKVGLCRFPQRTAARGSARQPHARPPAHRSSVSEERVGAECERRVHPISE